MADAAHVELHGVGVQPNGYGAVSHQPLRHLCFILGDFYTASHTCYYTCPSKESNVKATEATRATTTSVLPDNPAKFTTTIAPSMLNGTGIFGNDLI
jgi:hypothetical protein